MITSQSDGAGNGCGPPRWHSPPLTLCPVPLSKCCDLGFHASLARTFRTYLSAEYNLETSRHEGLDVIENAVDNLDSRSDKHTVMDMCNQVFCPPLKFEFQPHMGDEVGVSQEPVLRLLQPLLPRAPGMPVGGECQPRCTRRMRVSEAWGQALGSWACPAEEFTTSALILLLRPPTRRIAGPYPRFKALPVVSRRRPGSPPSDPKQSSDILPSMPSDHGGPSLPTATLTSSLARAWPVSSAASPWQTSRLISFSTVRLRSLLWSGGKMAEGTCHWPHSSTLLIQVSQNPLRK